MDQSESWLGLQKASPTSRLRSTLSPISSSYTVRYGRSCIFSNYHGRYAAHMEELNSKNVTRTKYGVALWTPGNQCATSANCSTVRSKKDPKTQALHSPLVDILLKVVAKGMHKGASAQGSCREPFLSAAQCLILCHSTIIFMMVIPTALAVRVS